MAMASWTPLCGRLIALAVALMAAAGCQADTVEVATVAPPPVESTVATESVPAETDSVAEPKVSAQGGNAKDVSESPAEEPYQPTIESLAASESRPTSDARAHNGRADADVLFVRAVQAADETWTFHVTVSHPDIGWEDYADGWDVVLADGTILKANPEDPFTRLLLHPHENEQPFTRSQRGLSIPAGVTYVTVRAHDLVDGFGGIEVIVDLTTSAGPGFEVEGA